jgi:hypothetical protein
VAQPPPTSVVPRWEADGTAQAIGRAGARFQCDARRLPWRFESSHVHASVALSGDELRGQRPAKHARLKMSWRPSELQLSVALERVAHAHEL